MSSGEEDYSVEPVVIPERVKVFIKQFHAAFANADIGMLRVCYFKEWTELTEVFYKEKEWPSEQELYSVLENEGDVDELFLACYTELYFRHIFLNGAPMIVHRVQSYENYNRLFALLQENVTSSSDVEQNLPIEWINDMFDECLYQFEDFCSVKHALDSLEEEELEDLANNINTWDISRLIKTLEKFASFYVQSFKVGATKLNIGTLAEKLGFCSIMSLSRTQVLLADYYHALKHLEHIDLYDKRASFTRLNSMHITLVYYTGFAFLMSRRYQDASNLFSSFLALHNNQRQSQPKSFSDSQFSRKCDKIRNLLKLARVLLITVAPTEVSGEVAAQLNEMSLSDVQTCFIKNAPRFINPAAPNLEQLENREKDVADVQVKWFTREVQTMRNLPEMKSILKLYSSISLEKLSRLSNLPVDKLMQSLICIKNKSYQYLNSDEEKLGQTDETAQSGSTKYDYTLGTLESVSNLHFYIENNTVFVDEKPKKKKFADFFLQNTLRLNQCVKDVEKQRLIGEKRGSQRSRTKNN